MAPGPVVNVVRYSALGGGIVYGIVHRRTLQKQQDAAVEQEIEQHRKKWIEEAKQEWKEKSSGSGLTSVLSNLFTSSS